MNNRLMMLKKINPDRLLWFFFAVAVALPSLLSYCSRPLVIGGDGLAYYAPLRSLFIDGDLDFTNEFRDFNPNHHVVPDFSVKTATGLVGDKYGIGAALLWLPFFLVAHGLALLMHFFGVWFRADGYSPPYQLAVGIGSMTYGLAGLYCIYKTCCFYFTRKIAACAVILVTLGTNVYYYFIVEPSMSHLLSLCTVSVFVYLTVLRHGRHTWRTALLMGLALGLAAIVRFQNLCFGIILIYEVVERTRRLAFKELIALIVPFMAGVTAAIVPQLVFWKIIYGSYFAYSYGSEGFNFLHPQLLKMLFSFNHGLITWTPLIGFCLLGLYFFITHAAKPDNSATAPEKQQVLGMLLALVFLMQWYLGASWHCWSFATSFGQRIMADISVVFAVGLAAFLERIWSSKAKRSVFLLTACGLVAWNLFLILVVTKHLFRHPNIINRIFMLEG